MKSLKIIQVIAKICKIFFSVMFVLSIVALLLTIVTMAVYPFAQDVEINGTTIKLTLIEKGSITTEELYVALALATLFSAAEIWLAYRSKKYFEHELEEGQPFTVPLARELRSLGFLHFGVGIGTATAAAITIEVAQNIFPTMDFSRSVSTPGNFYLGLVMLVISLLCEYGAERTPSDSNESKKQ